MPSRIVPILALVIAAAVLVPLRRARKAFPVRSEVAGVLATPRVSMRRRPAARAPVPVRIPATLAPQIGRDVPAAAGGGAVRAVRHAPGLPEVRSPGAKHSWARPLSFAPHPGAAGAVNDDGGDQLRDGVDCFLRPDRAGVPAPNPLTTAVAMRPAGDVPVPPPKHAA